VNPVLLWEFGKPNEQLLNSNENRSIVKAVEQSSVGSEDYSMHIIKEGGYSTNWDYVQLASYLATEIYENYIQFILQNIITVNSPFAC
jgi:hypothetical protein